MPYTVTDAKLNVYYKCARCGHEGHTDETEADEFVGNCFSVVSFQCPNCGADLDHDENGNLDWDDSTNDGGDEYEDEYEDDE